MSDRDDAQVRAACAVMVNHAGWTRTLGMLNFVMGGLFALTIVGLLLTWVFVWIGLVLMRAARALDDARANPARQDQAVREAMRQLAFHFTQQAMILGVLLVLYVLATLSGSLDSLGSLGVH